MSYQSFSYCILLSTSLTLIWENKVVNEYYDYDLLSYLVAWSIFSIFSLTWNFRFFRSCCYSAYFLARRQRRHSTSHKSKTQWYHINIQRIQACLYACLDFDELVTPHKTTIKIAWIESAMYKYQTLVNFKKYVVWWIGEKSQKYEILTHVCTNLCTPWQGEQVFTDLLWLLRLPATKHEA